MRLRFVPLMLLFCASLYAADSPFNGTWKLNVDKSHMIPPAPKSATARVENDGDNFKMKFESVDDKGVATTSTWDAKLDGKDYPATGDPMYDSVAIERVNDRAIKITGKKGGNVMWKEKVTVSKDGHISKTDFVATIDGKEQTETGIYEKQ